MGRSTTADWQIAGGHMAERCALFMIVALGESILVTGTTYSELDSSPLRLAALIVAFAGSVALWWIYFDRSAAASTLVIEESDDPGRLGRSAFTYVHIPMVAGVIVLAAGDELVIAHPTGDASAATIATVVLGPALFVLGHALFKYVVWRVISIPRVVGLACLLALLVVGQVVSPLVLLILVSLVLGVVAGLDAAMLYDPATRTRRWRWTPATSST
jgi:low temperature requirement protein LtrA